MEYNKGLKYFILFSYIVLSSCGYKKKYANEDDLVTHISICLSNSNETFVNASEYISNIEYVALETSDQCLIGGHTITNISENYIIATGENKCLLFSRQGKFIRTIGNQGQGPRDYSSLIDNMFIDEKSEMIYFYTLNELIAHRISGEFVKKLNLREFAEKIGVRWLPVISHWKDDLFCATIDLNSGKESLRFVIFTLDGEIIKLYPNHVKFDSEVRMSAINIDADIYVRNGQLIFKEAGCDTIFRITDSLTLASNVIFDLCGRKFTIEDRGKNSQRYTQIVGITEVSQYILFSCIFGDKSPKGFKSGGIFCLYDMKNDKIVSCKNDPHVEKHLAEIPNIFGGQYNHTQMLKPIGYDFGLMNDIDGGPHFWPSMNACIQNDKQSVQILQPLKLKESLTEKYFSTRDIKDREAHQRLKNMLEKLDFDDNPLLMIATFK